MPEEKKALSLKYMLPRISETAAIDIPRHAKGLLFRLHTITGWKLPEDELFLNTLVSEFTQYLVERCGDLNPEEIAHAFRNYSLEVKDWGKSMNLSLIDEPIREYRIKRRELSAIEERAAISRGGAKNEELPPAECDWSKEWAKLLEMAKNGRIHNAVILTPIYDWLDRTGVLKLSTGEKYELMNDCRGVFLSDLQAELAEGSMSPGERTLKSALLKKLQSDDWIKDPEIKARLISLSKIRAVRELAISESI